MKVPFLRRSRRAATPLRMTPSQQALLRCPECRSELNHHAEQSELRCRGGHRWPVVHGVPVFSDAGTDVEVRPLDHESHQPSATMVQLFAGATGPWLHLGAGATSQPVPNSIELETAIFANTHVVGDVHRLPFADESLGGVMALNVFEHLSHPDRAAAELYRCLAPGSRVLVHTAFLQPLHADPYHFYNASETGVRRWFEAFAVDSVTVPGNFSPAFTFSWLSSELLFSTADPHIASATVADLARFWREPSTRSGPLWDAFMQLPDERQRVLAAGFEIVCTRPSSSRGSLAP